jgi:hypothetical protein
MKMDAAIKLPNHFYYEIGEKKLVEAINLDKTGVAYDLSNNIILAEVLDATNEGSRTQNGRITDKNGKEYELTESYNTITINPEGDNNTITITKTNYGNTITVEDQSSSAYKAKGECDPDNATGTIVDNSGTTTFYSDYIETPSGDNITIAPAGSGFDIDSEWDDIDKTITGSGYDFTFKNNNAGSYNFDYTISGDANNMYMDTNEDDVSNKWIERYKESDGTKHQLIHDYDGGIWDEADAQLW